MLRNIAVLAMYIGMLVLIRMMSIVDMTWRNIAMSSSETQAYSAAEFLEKSFNEIISGTGRAIFVPSPVVYNLESSRRPSNADATGSWHGMRLGKGELTQTYQSIRGSCVAELIC